MPLSIDETRARIRELELFSECMALVGEPEFDDRMTLRGLRELRLSLGT